MTGLRRVILGMLVLGLSVVLVVGLVYAGNTSEGPVSDAMAWLGGRLANAERSLARRVSGDDRAEDLPWMDRYFESPAALRAPPTPLLGVYDSGLPGTLQGALELERDLGARFSFIQLYSAWGDKADQRFPSRVVEAIADLGSVPVLTWEPWLVDFENTIHPELPLRDDRDEGGMREIAEGAYDFYVDTWAYAAARFDRPMLLRFAHEMNDPYRYPWGPHNNSPDDFVAAWRHVVDRFRAAGADNVLWVWSPHVAYEGFEWFYPGDDYVDWIATGALNYGTAATWAQWWTFEETFGPHYEALAQWGKPIMLAELGSLEVGGDRARWYRDALEAIPDAYPAVRAVLFFHVASDATITYQALDWSFAGDSAVLGSVREALAGWPAPRSGEVPAPGR